MLKKEITFENLDGKKITRTFWFHLSKVQLARLNFSEKGGLDKVFKQMLDDKDEGKILKTFEDVISMAYGERHEDGEQFIQSPALSQAFMNTDAYSELFIELMSDPDAAANFVAGAVPADVRDNTASLQGFGSTTTLDVPVETLNLPATPEKPTAELSALGIPKPAEPLTGIPTFGEIQSALIDGRIGMLDMKLPQEELTRKIRGTS